MQSSCPHPEIINTSIDKWKSYTKWQKIEAVNIWLHERTPKLSYEDSTINPKWLSKNRIYIQEKSAQPLSLAAKKSTRQPPLSLFSSPSFFSSR